MDNTFYTKTDLISAYLILNKIKKDIIDKGEDDNDGTHVKEYLQVTFDRELKRIEKVLEDKDKALLSLLLGEY